MKRTAPGAAVLCAFGLLAGSAGARPAKLTTLYQFPGGGDAAFPLNAGVVNVGGLFYGVAVYGGAYGRGAVYAVDAKSGAETIVYSFQGLGDGAGPEAVLVLANGLLYGTTGSGGANGLGTIFSINPAGNVLTTLYSFTSVTGSNTTGALFPIGTTLYGTAATGGTSNYGTAFAFDTTTNSATTLYTFTGGADGASPSSGFVEYDGLLYSVASGGGAANAGTVFSIDPTSGAEHTIYSFTFGADGGMLDAPLVLVGKLLYGVAGYGGANGAGTLFSINPANGAEHTLYTFTGKADGGNPEAGLLALGNRLSGTTVTGGSDGKGTIFSYSLKTGQQTSLYAFTGGADSGTPDGQLIAIGNTLYGTATGPEVRNTDNGAVFSFNLKTGVEATLHEFIGANPLFAVAQDAALIAVGGTLYGTTTEGGLAYVGSVYSINPKTGAEMTLYTFKGGADGGFPNGALLISNGLLYGAAASGGSTNNGALFSIDPTTGTETTLYSFSGGSDGAVPNGGLLNVNGILYGTTSAGGTYGAGTIFKFDPSSNTLMTVYTFTFGNDGGLPQSGLIALGKLLYGTTEVGGAFFAGNVFSFDPSTSTETSLYPFTGGADGYFPKSHLVAIGGNLYGTTVYGGTQEPQCYGLGCGVVYEVNPSTGAESVVHAFSGSDGVFPTQALTVVGKTLYGGAGNMIFDINTRSNSFTPLYAFPGGIGPSGLAAPLLAVGKAFYGISAGGTVNMGEVFSFVP